ncbi:MAG: flagellar biosynthesis protein FlhA [Bacillota bacterium]
MKTSGRYADILIAAAILLMVVMMVIPLPEFLLDLLLTLNLTIALTVLLVTMYTTEPLQFSIFPSLLLLTTLFRLALNVSSTRLILLYGSAGEVIRRFGDFVVGGSPVVGFIVFLILVIIQFVVITNGAGRVAEVAARFTLDAMPGKQMAIDADLNAGLITESEARTRRRDIQRQADFYGAMDGASKFVKGDAIAGVIITVINLLGGFVIGVAMRGLSWDQALQQYSLLTVGDGLVSQIPALLISTATGIIVTRAASESNLGSDLIGQILRQPRVLYIATAALALFGLVPGLPKLPFFVMAGLFGTLAYSAGRAGPAAAADPEAEEIPETPQKPEDVKSLLGVDPMEMELGYALLPLADQRSGGDLLDRLLMIRRQIALDVGIIVPTMRIRDNLQLEPNQYLFKLRGVEIGRGTVYPDQFLAMSPGEVAETVPGIETTEPAFGLPALWITGEHRERAEWAGYTVVDATSVMATHLTELIKRYAHQILSRQDVRSLLDHVRESNPAVVEELVPGMMSLGDVQKILQGLLREGVSLRDMVSILEALADSAPSVKDLDLLGEYVRSALGRSICRQAGLTGDEARVLTLSPEAEQAIADAVQRTESGTYLALDPQITGRLLNNLAREVQKLTATGASPVVVCSAAVRLYFRRLTERAMPRLAVLAYNELDPDLQVESVGMVTI